MSTALTTHNAAGSLAVTTQSEPSFESLVSMGDALRRTGFLPSHIRDGVSFAAIVLMGRELGMGTMAACRKLQVIKGTVTERADSQLARFKSCGGRAQFKELTEARAVLVLRHPNGDEHTETFTIEDAKRAGLASNDNYAKHPKAMLRSRAITAGLKSIGWEGSVGIYDPDEIADAPAPEPAREPVVVRPKFPSTESRPAAVERGHAPATAVDSHAQQTAQPPALSATNDPVANARLAVQRTNSLELLAALRDRVNQRHKEGTFTEAQRNELVHLIDGKCEWLESEPEDNGQEFDHEAAATEAKS
jgi:hypothetical protein